MRARFNLAIRPLAAWVIALAVTWVVLNLLFPFDRTLSGMVTVSALFSSPFILVAVIVCFAAHNAVLRNPAAWAMTAAFIPILLVSVLNPFLAVFAVVVAVTAAAAFLASLRIWPITVSGLPSI
jgi:hypothetical protein